eukprot:3308401-Alexandrium_andersonii.AAC.1
MVMCLAKLNVGIAAQVGANVDLGHCFSGAHCHNKHCGRMWMCHSRFWPQLRCRGVTPMISPAPRPGK